MTEGLDNPLVVLELRRRGSARLRRLGWMATAVILALGVLGWRFLPGWPGDRRILIGLIAALSFWAAWNVSVVPQVVLARGSAHPADLLVTGLSGRKILLGYLAIAYLNWGPAALTALVVGLALIWQLSGEMSLAILTGLVIGGQFVLHQGAGALPKARYLLERAARGDYKRVWALTGAPLVQLTAVLLTAWQGWAYWWVLAGWRQTTATPSRFHIWLLHPPAWFPDFLFDPLAVHFPLLLSLLVGCACFHWACRVLDRRTAA